MEPYWCGVEWNWQTGRKGRPVVLASDRHVSIFGPTRCGKGITNEAVNLLWGGDPALYRLAGLPVLGRRFRCDSTFNIDPKLQNCAICMKWCSRFSTVWVLNPRG
ncbi:MAG TPA: hypothetical protein VHX39_28645, partial [Acetobacteraceae bacterium]|nr:hypothetical protein [Acetobacteraceae bacterium]